MHWLLTKLKPSLKPSTIATILGIRDYAVYALMYQLGLRVGEVHDLDLESLDFKNAKITVMGKGRKPRTLHLNDELIEILSHYLSRPGIVLKQLAYKRPFCLQKRQSAGHPHHGRQL